MERQPERPQLLTDGDDDAHALMWAGITEPGQHYYVMFCCPRGHDSIIDWTHLSMAMLGWLEERDWIRTTVSYTSRPERLTEPADSSIEQMYKLVADLMGGIGHMPPYRFRIYEVLPQSARFVPLLARSHGDHWEPMEGACDAPPA